jgi:hypothetical protein
MKIPVLGLDDVPMVASSSGIATIYEGHGGLLSMALDPEYQRRERDLAEYLKRRRVHIFVGNDALH